MILVSKEFDKKEKLLMNYQNSKYEFIPKFNYNRNDLHYKYNISKRVNLCSNIHANGNFGIKIMKFDVNNEWIHLDIIIISKRDNFQSNIELNGTYNM